MSAPTHFPLAWPLRWPRTSRFDRQRSKFGDRRYGSRGLAMAPTLDELDTELRRLKVVDFILSTNVRLTSRGWPQANAAQPDDPGVALYFKLGGKDHVLACDRWAKVEENIRALVLHIEALRGMERWGVGSVLQAFAGYAALPAAAVSRERPWQDVLELPGDASIETIQARFRELAEKFHSDRPGGSHDAMAELAAARDQAIAAKKG